MGNLFDRIVKAAGNEEATLVEEGLYTDVTTFIDTGSYAFNALLSGSIYGGLAGNKVTALAGEPAVGKTFYLLSIVKHFLDANPKGACVLFEDEGAITSQMLKERGLDTKRVYLIPVVTIQEFRTQAMKMINEYLAVDLEDREPLIMGLDSLGSISTDKEVTDIAEGADKRDMTRAQLIRGTFRALTLKLAKANVPLIITNHVAVTIGDYIPVNEMGGGQGLKYAASIVIYLTKSKRKDATTNEVTGVVIKATQRKGRITIENRSVETLLDYRKGLDRYYGLLPIAAAAGIATKVSTQYTIGGQKAFESAIIRDPAKYFTKDILDQIDEACGRMFKYGEGSKDEDTE